MPTGRSLLELVRGADGKLYAIGGCCDETYEEHFLGVPTVEAYNPATRSWAAKAPMPSQFGSGVYGLSAALARNGKIYTFGGEPTSGEDWPTATRWTRSLRRLVLEYTVPASSSGRYCWSTCPPG